MDQGPPHKTWHTETNRKETGEDPGGHGRRGKDLTFKSAVHRSLVVGISHR